MSGMLYMEAATYLKYMVEISTLVGIVLVMSTLTCDAFLLYKFLQYGFSSINTVSS